MNMEQEKLKQQQQQQQQRVKPPELVRQNQNQPPPPQNCPRCDSSNTKFCYYNNYSLSQPRYFCKNCRRYWTHGGTLRNVPVGGGCRKSKRPKPSVPSPSGGGIGTSQPLSPALPPQSLTASNSSRPLPPIMPPIGNTFYNGGSFLSSLAAMHSFSGGISQGAAVNLGGGSGPYDANMTLLQGVGLQSIKPPPSPPQYQPPLNSWTQSFINRCPAADTTSSSAATSGFWSGATADNRAGSSFDPNHWQDGNPGFNP